MAQSFSVELVGVERSRPVTPGSRNFVMRATGTLNPQFAQIIVLPGPSGRVGRRRRPGRRPLPPCVTLQTQLPAGLERRSQIVTVATLRWLPDFGWRA